MPESCGPEAPKEGDEVVEVMIAPHPCRPPAWGRVTRIVNGEAVVRCPNGYEELVPLGRFGRARPQARWKVVRPRG